ncbi:MAG: SHOCT domain-containing protein [Sulfurospirillum sp.]|nr:SHOCT domain-containing protein [Sulfurospirillum sp.]
MFYDGTHWFIGFPMMFMLLGFFIFVYLLLRATSWGQKDSKETPLEILKRRLANGEISHEEFDIMKKKIDDI